MKKQSQKQNNPNSEIFLNPKGISYKHHQLYIRLPENKVLSIHENYLKQMLGVEFESTDSTIFRNKKSETFITHQYASYKNCRIYLTLENGKVVSLHENLIKKILDVPFTPVKKDSSKINVA